MPKTVVSATCILLLVLVFFILPAYAGTGAEEKVTPTEYPTITEPTEIPTEEPTAVPTETVTPVETTHPVPGPYAPVAGFTASPTAGDSPLAVRFTDTSLNSPTMWYWDFGDGSTDATRDPAHTYTNAGSYTVTLTAGNQYGSDTVTKTGLVTVNGQVMDNGAIYAQSFPAGATIYVNGNSYGPSPVTINSLLPGTYSVMAVLDGYSADTRAVIVNPGGATGYYPVLQPSPNPPGTLGAISARSSPAGAMIYVNGVAYGTSPRTISNLLPGTYSVMAALNGYGTDTRVVTVAAGQTTGYTPVLQPSPDPAAGAIFAQSVPAGAAVYLNGVYQGISPVTITNLAPGTYTLRAALSGYADDVQQVTARAGQVSLYVPVLYPSPPVVGSGQGIIAVYTNVNGAAVYFDDAFTGNVTNGVLFVPVAATGTPVKIVRVESAGYTPFTAGLPGWPASGEIVKVEATLVPGGAPTATPAKSPVPAALAIGAVLGAGAVVLAARRK